MGYFSNGPTNTQINLTKQFFLCKKIYQKDFRKNLKFYSSKVKKYKNAFRGALREKCTNTEFFLVRTFLYSVQIQENTDQKNFDTFHGVDELKTFPFTAIEMISDISFLQTHHVDSTLKRRGNDRFHVVSTWNPRSVCKFNTFLLMHCRFVHFSEAAVQRCS